VSFTGVLPILLLAVLSAGCEKLATAFGRSTIPDLGAQIPVTVKMEFDPSLTKAREQFINACNSPQELRVGEELESTLLQAAHQTFKTVYFSGRTPPNAKSDLDIRFALQQSGLKIQTDGIYDRLPADLTIEVVAIFKDPSGKVILEQPLTVRRQEKLILEPTQHRCMYVNSEKLLRDAAVVLSVQFIQHARTLVDPNSQYAAVSQGSGSPPSQASPPVAQPAAQTPPAIPIGEPALSFKATVLDENNNLILEGGERIKLRVDLVNAGRGSARDVSVAVSGTPAIISQFPATTLPVGLLQPGESRSVEFSATLPPLVQAQRAELQVAIAEASGVGVPAAQTLVVALRRSGENPAGAPAARSDEDVDQIPGNSAGFQRPETHLLAVGIGTYRDQQIPKRKFAAQDAELVAAYFQSIGGVPAVNVRVLQDRKALRPDIEEAILDWLPPRLSPESVVIVYFSGQAKVTSSGETYLVPYEGGGSSAARLYPLRDLQAALAKLKARHTLFIFDGSVSRLGKDTGSKFKAPQWEAGGDSVVRLIGTTGLQAALEPDRLRHGLFTYYLLRGLRGEADANHDGEVTLGELTSFLGRTVPVAAKNQFSQEQRPLVIPPMTPKSKVAALALAKPTANLNSNSQ
jgi:hypothetical protein